MRNDTYLTTAISRESTFQSEHGFLPWQVSSHGRQNGKILAWVLVSQRMDPTKEVVRVL